MSEMKLSPAMEDYIETIYLLESKNKVARVSDIGRAMSVRKASVVSAVTNLQKAELIAHEKYGYITLTELGRKTAESIYRKHKILLEFLEQILKVEPVQAKDEACMIEHSLSQDTVNKLEVFIKNYRSLILPKPAKEKATVKKKPIVRSDKKTGKDKKTKKK